MARILQNLLHWWMVHCSSVASSDRNGIIFNNKMRMHLHTNLYTLLSVGLHVVVVEVVVVVVVVMLAIS